MSIEFLPRKDAENKLKSLGMKRNYASGNRVYWWYGDGSDRLLDHCATITSLAGKVALSIYERKAVMK